MISLRQTLLILLLATTVSLTLASSGKRPANEQGAVPRETVDHTDHAHATSPAPPGPAQAFLAALRDQQDALSVPDLEQTLAWLQAGAAQAVQEVLAARLPVRVQTLAGGQFQLRVRDGADAIARAKAQIQATQGSSTRLQRLFVVPEATEPSAKKRRVDAGAGAGAGADAHGEQPEPRELDDTEPLPTREGAPAALLLMVDTDAASFSPTKKHNAIQLAPAGCVHDCTTATAAASWFTLSGSAVVLLEGPTKARLKLGGGATTGYIALGVVPAGRADFGRSLEEDGYAYGLEGGTFWSRPYGGFVEVLPKLGTSCWDGVQDGDEVLVQLSGDTLTYSIFQGGSQTLRPHPQNPFSVTVDAAVAEGAGALAVQFYGGDGQVSIVDHA